MIPQTLKEARELSGVRFSEWNADCIALLEDMLKEGRQIDIMGHVDPFAVRVRELSEKLDESRLMNAIGNCASKLGVNVANY
jgi:hypothetical protein